MAFDPNQPFTILEEEEVGFDPTKPFSIETKPSGTSFGEEVSQLGSAFVESIGRPLENMGESFESFGFSGVANALKGAITEPENYVSAGQRFMEPSPDEAQLMGFAWQYAPRAAVEQVGQAIGSIGTRAVGAAAGGAVAGPPGVIAGGFLGPAVFGAAQVIGPVAKERAMNNGREVPNNSDLVAATLTAIGSGSLDAIGAKYLPGGDKATGKFFKRVASAFAGEGLLTEAPQSVIEQIGATAGTEKGLNINVKQAVGEGLIGGTSAAGLTAIVSPFSKPAENQVIRTPEEAEELDIDSKANQEAVLLMGDPADQTQNERVTKLKEIESVIANNETLMTGLEPNAPERSKLDLENRVAKKEAEKLKAEITQGAGLSETITEAEKQQIELGKLIAAPPEEKPKSAIEQINQERINLDERAKVFGAINARQFNTQNVLNENLTEEENTLLGDYANLQVKIRNLSWRDASQLSPEDFSVWQKPKFTDKAASDAELTDLGKLLSALDARGETEKVDVVRKNIEGSKRKADWTIDSWQERFDESKTQEEIDTINSDNNDWNDSVDTLLDLVKQKTKPPAEEKPAAPVSAPVPKAPTEPPVSMVGKQVIPGVTPVPVVAKAKPAPTKAKTELEKLEDKKQKLILSGAKRIKLVEINSQIEQARQKQIRELEAKGKAIEFVAEMREESRQAQETADRQVKAVAWRNTKQSLPNEWVAANDIINNDSEKLTLSIDEGKVTPERSIELVDEAVSSEAITQVSADIFKKKIQKTFATPAPTEPTVNQSLTVAPVEEETFGKLPTAEVKTTLSENVAEREKPSVKPLKQPSIKQLIARREPIPAKKAYGYKLPSEYKLNYDTEMWEAAPVEAPSITPAPVAETPAVAPAAKQALPKAIIQRLLKDGVEIIPSGNQYSGFRQLVMEKLGKPSPKSKSGTNAVKKELIQYLGVDTNDTIAGIDNSIRSKLRQMLENITAPTPAVSETITPAASLLSELGEGWKLDGTIISKDGFGHWTEKQRDEARAIFKKAGIRTNTSTLSGSGNRKSSFTILSEDARRIQDEIFAEDVKLRKAKNEQAKADEEAKQAEKLSRVDPAAKRWMDSLFGQDDFANPANKVHLSDFVTGKTTKFGGMVNPRWFDGVQAAGAVLEGSKVDFQKLKENFENSVAKTAPEVTAEEGISVGNRIKLGKSPQTYTVEEVVPQSEVEKANGEQFYSVKNEKTGEVQVVEKADMKQVKKSADTRKTKVSDTQYQTEGVVPKENRFTEDEVRSIINEIFEGKIPDRVKIIEDENNPNLDFKGAYSLRAGTITYNLAYLAKGDDLRFVTNHELGHSILGDPKFQKEMARLFDTLPTDIQEKLKKAIDEAYSQEGLGVRAEETIVFAFGEILENAPDGRNILQRFLDAIRDAINRLFKTEGYIPRNPKKAAAAILLAARNKFERGEFIRRGDGSILKMTPTSPKDVMRDAEYLAAVERGDMETAQSMVDEAAKKAGFNQRVFHGSPKKFQGSQFKKSTFHDGFFFTNNLELARYYAEGEFNEGDVENVREFFIPDTDRRIAFADQTDDESLAIKAKNYLRRNNDAVVELADIKDTYEGEFYQPGTSVFAVWEPSKIKSAEPVIRDDAGNVIPLSQRFQPSEPDIRRMAVERKEIMGKKIGELKDTPKNIIAKTKVLLRERVFNPSEVTEQNTTEAFRALGKLTGNKQERRDFADELNDIATIVEDTGAAAEVSMGAALFVNDLFEYAVRLAAEGQKMMLGIMMTNINNLPTGTEGRTGAGQALRAAREMRDTFLTMAKAEQNAFINYAAEFVYGPNPTKDQIDSIRQGYEAVEEVKEPTAKEVEEEIAAVGEKTGTDLVGKINEEFTKATEKGKEKRKTEEAELDSEYKKIQEQADKEIEKLAKIQSDTPSFDPAAARQTANDVRAIVANDLKQRPDMGRKAPWKSLLVAKLQEAGVEVAAAETLADIVWRQHEINSLSRELSSIDKAIEKGPISEIIKAIKETPLEEQQKPNWRYEVMRDYLRKAGLPLAQAERIAKLMDISLQKRLTQAKEQAFTDAISKTAPWKSGNVRSKRAFQQVIQAIRAGALDPSRNMASDIAALNGWTGFTADQYKNLLKFDTILADEKTGELEKANAYKGVQDIISKSKLPIRARDVIAQYYDAQALSGIPTLSVNSFSPIAFAMRNAIIEAGAGTVKGDPKAIGGASKIFVDSIKSWANTVAFSFKNNVTVYSNVDYIVNDDNLLRLYRRGVDQFQKGNTPRDRADGIKNIMIGMMDYVRRVLNALDYGAIAALQNQNVGKYAMAVMKRNNISEKKANEIFAAMMKEKNDFYLNQIAIGTDKNKARILADEYYVASWGKALEKTGIGAEKIKSAMDSAINDALSSVGRNRQSLDAFKEEATNMRDAGLASAPALWLLESIANAANQSNSQVTKLFARMIYGFAIVPARVIRETAWFSPYGLVRLAVDAGMRNRNMDSRYAQSLGNEFQRQQRLNEAVAGTVALVALLALRAGSTDDPEDDDFKIVFTGNGPKRNDDPQFHDSWYKAGNKPNSMIVSFGKTKIPLNMMRGFEAFTWPAMMLGALDDLEIRKKQKQQTNTPAEIEDAAIVAGFVFDAALRRGPYAFTTKSLFGTYGDIGVEGVAKGLTFPAKTLIPVLGTSLASNLSNFLNDPIDRRTLDGAVWSNIPFIGPAVAPKALNAFGEPALATDFASKMFKLGVPIVYDIPTDRESIKLHELVLKQGGGPSIPTRNQLAQRLDRQPTNKEYEMFVREYGTILTTSMKKNYDRLFNAKAEFYSKAVERIGNRARDIAENKVRQAAKKP